MFTVLSRGIREACGHPGLVVEMDFRRWEVKARACGFGYSRGGADVGKTRFDVVVYTWVLLCGTGELLAGLSGGDVAVDRSDEAVTSS